METLKHEQEIKTRLNLSKCRSSRDSFPPPGQAPHENNRITAKGTMAEKDYRLNDCPYRSLKLFIRQKLLNMTLYFQLSCRTISVEVLLTKKRSRENFFGQIMYQ